MTSRGEILVGYLQGEQDQTIQKIAEMLSSVVPTTVSDNILANLYSKLLINSGSSTLGALSGLRLGQMLKIKRGRLIYLALVREAMDVARAMKLKVEPYAGKLNWYKLAYGPQWRAHIFMRLFGMKYKRLKSTSLQSIERGNKTEVDIFNGYIAGQGKAHNIPTPINTKLVNMVHEIERKKRPITLLNYNYFYGTNCTNNCH
jgi:2-dehydropantoate 2-reductase